MRIKHKPRIKKDDIEERELRKTIFKLNEFEAKSLLYHTILETLEKEFNKDTFAFEYLDIDKLLK